MGKQLGMTKLVVDRQVYFIGQQQVIQRHVDVAKERKRQALSAQGQVNIRAA